MAEPTTAELIEQWEAAKASEAGAKDAADAIERDIRKRIEETGKSVVFRGYYYHPTLLGMVKHAVEILDAPAPPPADVEWFVEYRYGMGRVDESHPEEFGPHPTEATAREAIERRANRFANSPDRYRVVSRPKARAGEVTSPPPPVAPSPMPAICRERLRGDMELEPTIPGSGTFASYVAFEAVKPGVAPDFGRLSHLATPNQVEACLAWMRWRIDQLLNADPEPQRKD